MAIEKDTLDELFWHARPEGGVVEGWGFTGIAPMR